MHMYLHILRGYAKFHEKRIFFMSYAKKIKTCITKRTSFTKKKLHRPYKKLGFVNNFVST
jgi:hypothetical protein